MGGEFAKLGRNIVGIVIHQTMVKKSFLHDTILAPHNISCPTAANYAAWLIKSRTRLHSVGRATEKARFSAPPLAHDSRVIAYLATFHNIVTTYSVRRLDGEFYFIAWVIAIGAKIIDRSRTTIAFK